MKPIPSCTNSINMNRTAATWGPFFKGDRIDICIDDAGHKSEAILRTLESVMPHMNESFVYFVEDNATVCDEIRVLYPGYDIESCGELTIISHSPRSS